MVESRWIGFVVGPLDGTQLMVANSESHFEIKIPEERKIYYVYEATEPVTVTKIETHLYHRHTWRMKDGSKVDKFIYVTCTIEPDIGSR